MNDYVFYGAAMELNDKNKIKFLIFDLDGTLADTIWSIRDGVNMAMAKYGYPQRSYEEIREAIGNGARELVRRSMPVEASRDVSLVDSVLFDYESAYEEIYKTCDTCYDGMLEAIETLRAGGYAIAVLSNKQEKYVKGLVEVLLPENTCVSVRGQTALPKKPDPTVPLLMAEELGFAPGETAFIGDSEVDVQTGINAGMFTVGCAWGYRDRAVLESANADIVIDAPAQLVDIFG